MTAGTILLVEDEDIVRDSMVRVLRRAGLAAEGVASGEEALARMRDGRYDILLADIRMRGMSGLEFLERAKAIDPEVGAMVITGYGTLESAMAAVDLGIQGFILKPVAPEELVRRVMGGLGKARAWRELHRMSVISPLLSISSQVDLDQALREAARVVGEGCGGRHVSIHLLDEVGALRLAASWGDHPVLSGVAMEQREPLREWVAHRGEALLLGEEELRGDALGIGRELHGMGIASALYQPIVLRGDTLGMLALLRGANTPPLSEGDGAFLSLVCTLLALLVAGPELQV
ncbi:MAG: response regulator receiver protein [Dehalococcoidia bacterium]|nr:response regulator receiver protein [Dehalococcoidia bacterium]